MCVCVSVCVRERERGWGWEGEIHTSTDDSWWHSKMSNLCCASPLVPVLLVKKAKTGKGQLRSYAKWYFVLAFCLFFFQSFHHLKCKWAASNATLDLSVRKLVEPRSEPGDAGCEALPHPPKTIMTELKSVRIGKNRPSAVRVKIGGTVAMD